MTGTLIRHLAKGAVALGIALGLTACEGPDVVFEQDPPSVAFPESRPAEVLWPTASLPDRTDWQPAAETVDNFGSFADQVRIATGRVDGRTTTTIENLDPARAITVYYEDRSGSYQAVVVDPGAALPVAAAPRRIIDIE